ncbi:MAG: S26 family signal peptidase, partial [Paracoccaceae bacterium]|nr:S26 family signal peptidase [Paracoccaceae bacterium]
MTPSDCIPRDPATPDAKRRIVYGLWAVVALVAATFGGAQAAGFRLNMTASAPEGLWQIVEGAPLKTIRRGMIVSVCPPDAPVVRAMRAKGYLEPGFCPSGTVPFLKPVAAIPGDVVTVASGQPLAV